MTSKILTAIGLVICLLVISQFSLFLYERDVLASDAITSPPLSGEFQLFGGPISDAREKMGIFRKYSYWKAIREFPTLESCSIVGASGARHYPRINWNKLNSEEKIRLCLHHVVSYLNSPDQLIEWFSFEGFLYSGNARYKKTITINLKWDVSRNDNLSPMNNMYFRYMSEFTTSSPVFIQVVFDVEKNKLISSSVHYVRK